MFFTHDTLHGQTTIGFLEYEPEVYENTIANIYDVWYKSEASQKHDVDTILCTFLAGFGDLNFEESMQEKELMQNMRMIKPTLAISPYKRKFFFFKKRMPLVISQIDSLYHCTCEVFNTASKKIATIDSQESYYVFERFNDNKDYGNEHLKLRLVELENLIVLRPASSRIQMFNFNWRVAVDKAGNLVWYHLDRPETSYSTEEVRQNYFKDLLMGRPRKDD